MAYVLLVFGIYWIAFQRKKLGWAMTLVTLVMQVLPLAVLGRLAGDGAGKAALLAYVALPFWLAPLVIWRRQRFPAETSLAPYDEERDGPLPELRERMEGPVAALEAAGLVRAGTYIARDVPNVTWLHAHLETEDGLEAVSVSCGRAVGRLVDAQIERHVSVSMRFEGGRRLWMSNRPHGDLPRVDGMRVEVLPSVQDPLRLLTAARGYRARFMADAHAVPVRGGALAVEFFRERYRSLCEAEARAGRYRRVRDGWAPTLWGAVRLSSTTVFPLRQVAMLLLRRRERALLRELGMGQAPATPAGAWVGPLDVQAAAAVAIAVLAFGPVPAVPDLALPVDATPAAAFSAPRIPKPYTMPAGFAVPADFPGAVRALERLTGSAAVPLELEDYDTGEPIRADGFEVRFAADQTDSLLAAAAPLFRARGFLLFRNGTTFGIGGEPERVALYPRDAPAEVMRLVQTNGANYGIYTDSVIAWFGTLNARHPFVVTGIGMDHLEGRFLRAPDAREARTLARDFFAFCPDVVHQGTGTVRALENELRTSAVVYCWWD